MALETTVDQPGLKTGYHVPGNTRANLKSIWVFTVLWNLVSAPVLVYVPPELTRQPLAALGFLFPIVGAGLLAWALVTTARARRFGDTWLDTGAAAACPGGSWHATIEARLPRPEDGSRYAVSVKLTCLQRTIHRHNDSREERETILWREEDEVESTSITFGSEHASIPVGFDIPSDALETTAVGKGEGVLWVLTAEAALPGVNLREDFDVPVRRIAGSVASAAGRPEGAAVSDDDLARTGITVEPSPDGMRFTFAPARNVSFAAGTSALTAIFVGALWMQFYLGFPWFFRIVTALVDLLLLYVVIDLWLGVTVVVAGNGALRVRHTVLGLGGTRRIYAAEIAAIGLHINMQTQGRYGTPYYEVRATLKNGRKHSLGDGIRHKRHAEWLAAQMRTAIGMK